MKCVNLALSKLVILKYQDGNEGAECTFNIFDKINLIYFHKKYFKKF